MQTITVAYGDGIGPEIMESALDIISSSGAQVRFDSIEIGKAMYEHGWASGIPDSAWSVIKRNKILFKAPITTPQGKGFQSLNVRLRKAMGLYANVRPCMDFMTGKKIDIVVVRENSEDLYTGVEYHQTLDSYHSIKFITYSASYRICRYAFEYAKSEGRKKVTCLVKDNIMKMTDGAFHRAFDKVAADYPGIKAEVMILDIGMARVATNPEAFDVIVTSNLYGDVVSDVAAELSGSVGMSASLNIGDTYSMFEAIHGSAPDIAGKGIANPSGLINAAIYMLAFLGQKAPAAKIYNAWRKTIADGMHTADIYKEGVSKYKFNTKDFTEAVIDNMGCGDLYGFVGCDIGRKIEAEQEIFPAARVLVGADMFVQWNSANINELMRKLKEVSQQFNCSVQLISKGLLLWPDSEVLDSGIASDNFCCRLLAQGDDVKMTHDEVVEILGAFHHKYSVEVVKLEKLYTISGKPCYSVFAA